MSKDAGPERAGPRIVLLHATAVAMEPVRAAFAARWRDAELVNLLDDGLSTDRARQGGLTEAMIERFVDLGSYGARTGADGILVTCSAFGPAIDRLKARLAIPVLKPNEAMFRAAIARGLRIGMLATFGPAIATMTDEFNEFAHEVGSAATLEVVFVEKAMDHLRRGETEDHDRLVARSAAALAGCDVVMLAQFSTARAADDVRTVLDVPVLTAPESAVDLMKQHMLGADGPGREES